MVAGEASGDLHAGGVARELKALRPAIEIDAVGGRHLREAGALLLRDYAELAVMGFAEVVKHIPRHFALLREIKTRLRSGDYGLVILVDYPGFNLKVAAAAREAGIPVLYYVTPQVWAWGAGRLPKMARVITRAAVILPFEENLLRGHGIDARFVGHPLLDRATSLPTRDRARADLGIENGARMLVLFPGSRVQEITHHLDDFVETARILQSRNPSLRVLVSGAPDMDLSPARCPYPVVHSASFTLLRAADAALCKSGTTTLEAAIAGCPLVVAYRTSRLSYALARKLVRIENIGLVNVVGSRTIAPEFVQDELVPVKVADSLDRLLDAQSPERARAVEGLAEVRGKLGDAGAARKVAGMAVELLA